MIDEADSAFYQKVSPTFANKKFLIPSPTLCPQCREQHRLVWRNEHKLYSRKCDLTNKDIISVHAANKKYPVYCSEAWWSDQWDALSYGKDFDFSTPFFDQFKELLAQVPRADLYNIQAENSEYNQSTGNLKNCYLLAGSNDDEDCYYGKYVYKSKNCLDSHVVEQCELCYECIDCKSCYHCAFLQDCTNCRDAQFLYSCSNCSDCFGCVNLVNKRYCLFNEQYSAEDYKKKRAEFDLSKHSELERIHDLMLNRLQEYPVRFMTGNNNESVTGNCLSYSKNSYACFDASELENCKYCVFFHQAKDCMDVFAWGMPAELCYNSMEVGGGTCQMLFSVTSFSSNNLLYCYQCHNSSHCFGCTGLKRQQYCIFNKQYSPDHYEEVVARIIKHMQKTGEWGEFFPMGMSGFAYNETIAYEQFPCDKASIIARQGLWQDEEPVKNSQKFIPDSIHEVANAILQETLICESCHKAYRLVHQELIYYRAQSLPVPRKCFSCRHLARLAKRNPHKLWERNCSQCDVGISTTVSPEVKRLVYCEKCYQELVY